MPRQQITKEAPLSPRSNSSSTTRRGRRAVLFLGWVLLTIMATVHSGLQSANTIATFKAAVAVVARDGVISNTPGTGKDRAEDKKIDELPENPLRQTKKQAAGKTVLKPVSEEEQQSLLEDRSTSTNDALQTPSQPQNKNNTAKSRTLVIYGGPTDVLDMDQLLHPEALDGPDISRYKYHLNFEYFLQHGIQCNAHDTLIVVTNKVLPYYQRRIQAMDEACQKENNNNHRIFLTTRQNKCLDLEVLRVALYDAPSTPTLIQLDAYDYFFYINCGVSGPAKEVASLPWTDIFIEKLRNGVKMTGLSLNCAGGPHIQSMMYAMDQEALQLVMDGGAIFDCLERYPDFYNKTENVAHGLVVNAYERRMSTLLLQAGYGLDPYLKSQAIFKHNKSQCESEDLWLGRNLQNLTAPGRMPYLNETIFWKSTRYMTPALAQEIGYKAEIKFNWERQ
jgi:hypothetical protein